MGGGLMGFLNNLFGSSEPRAYRGESGKVYTKQDLVQDWHANHRARILAHTTIDNVSSAFGVPICSVDGIQYGIEWGGPSGGDPFVVVHKSFGEVR